MMWSVLLGDPVGENTSLTPGSSTKTGLLAAGLRHLRASRVGTDPPSFPVFQGLSPGEFPAAGLLEEFENRWLEKQKGNLHSRVQPLKKGGLGQRPAAELAQEAYPQMEQEPHTGHANGAGALGSEASSGEPSDGSVSAVRTGLASVRPRWL